MSYLSIGSSDLRIAPLGVGAWSWGARLVWGYGRGYDRADIAAAFQTSLAAGITLFDTAEIYGVGASERLVGELLRESGAAVLVATKYAPLPWRRAPHAVRRAIDHSLARLGRDQIDLYQAHWSSPFASISPLMDALADAVAEGKVRYVGVSNYDAAELRQAHAALARRGVALVSNQIEYSLLQRAPERNGVLATCRELNITPIAYSPLSMGVLTGKYRPGVRPRGLRRFGRRFTARRLALAQPVIALVRQIGAAHDGKTVAQVALRWLIQRGALPIPGAKSAGQAAENAGALGWELADAEMALLDVATRTWQR
jgi:aryl-alcohol dehydrogenase-like predicted oxidoreductase